MNREFSRKASPLESFFMDLDDCGSNMTFHLFLQVEQKPSLEQLNQAMQTMLETHPGVNMKFYNKAWHASQEIPPCTVIEADTDDVYNAAATKLDYRKNTVALNVIHTQNGNWFLCFDFFHGAMDGRSGIQFLYDFVDTINGHKTEKSEFATMDKDLVPLVASNGKMGSIPCWPKCEPKDWSPSERGVDKTVVLHTMARTRSMAAKLANAVGQYFRDQANIIIPVDVRRYAPTQKSMFGNLIVPIFVDANSNRRIEDLRVEILQDVKDIPFLAAILNSLFLYNAIPKKVRVWAIRHMIKAIMRHPKFICCALVSPVGTVERHRLETDAFQVVDVAVTFISFPFCAFTVTSLQFDDHTNTTVAWHSGRVSQETAEGLIQTIDETIRV